MELDTESFARGANLSERNVHLESCWSSIVPADSCVAWVNSTESRPARGEDSLVPLPMSEDSPESGSNTLLRRSEITFSFIAGDVGIQRRMVRLGNPTYKSFWGPSKGGHDAKTLKVVLVTGGIRR